MEAGKDTEALYTTDTCTILEVMGRNAGWIAAAAGLARREPQDAPHLIYLPEIPFTVDRFIEDCKEVYKEFGRIFIVAGEGIKGENGKIISEDAGAFSKDSFGHSQLGGVGDILKGLVEKEVGIKARVNKTGTNQRSASHFASLTDAEEAYMCGQAAVQAAIGGENGKMVALVRADGDEYKCGTELVDLGIVANEEKKVPREFINDRGNGVTDKMLDYVRPLVQGQVNPPIGDDGLPIYMRFKRKPLGKKLGEYI
jgi:6-phosphofructokinase 1